MAYHIELEDAYKQFTQDQDKIIPPEETVKRFQAKLAQLDLDILKRTIRIDSGRLDIPIYFSMCGKDAEDIIGNKKQMGKGATPIQAEASAVMELAERFSFFNFAKNPQNFFYEKYGNIKENAISFDMIARSVHDESQDLGVTRKIFENLTLKWAKGYNLTRGKEVLIPFDWFFSINEFNGPSAGNCREEALLQGICEIVERHTSSLVSHNRMRVPTVNTDSVTDSKVLEMLEKYRRNGIKLYITDFSLDTGIPTLGVLGYDPKTFPHTSEIVWTAGTTPDPQKALSRALTEVAQLAGDFNSGSNYIASGLPKFTRLEEAGYVINPGSEVNLTELPDLSNENMKVEVQNCLDALAKNDMEVLVIDTMHAELQIPAFYTIIPGAHFRERARGTSVGMFAAKHIVENRPPNDAIKELALFAEKLPDKYYLLFYTGLSHLNCGDPQAALPHLQKALDANPTDEDVPSIYSYMGLAYKDMGRYQEALEVLRRGIMMDAERTDIYNLMGFCHFKLQEHEKAIENFKKVVELNPSSAIDYANIASNYRDIGNKDKAIRYYQIALTLDPTIEFARDSLEKLER